MPRNKVTQVHTRITSAFGYNLQALAGMNHLTGYADGYPLGTSVNYPDFVLPMFVASVILSAILYRKRTGKGQHIDVSQYQAMASTLGPTLMDYLVNGRVQGRTGGRSPTAAPHGTYRCQGEERWCAIAVFTKAEWTALCRVMGDPPWTREPRFGTLMDRLHHLDDLDAALANAFWATNFAMYFSRMGLDAEAFSACLDTAKYAERVQTQMDVGTGLGVSSTPTVFINGRLLSGAQPYEVFTRIIDEELERAEAN